MAARTARTARTVEVRYNTQLVKYTLVFIVFTHYKLMIVKLAVVRRAITIYPKPIIFPKPIPTPIPVVIVIVIVIVISSR